MNTKHAVIVGVALIVAALAYALAVYPALGPAVPIHWNLYGEVDGYAPKEWGAFVMPGGMALFMALMLVLPLISPKRFKVESFRPTYNYVMVVLVALFGYIHVISLYQAGHPKFSSGTAMVSGLCAFIALVGNVLSKVRRNFWLGVRTPWTLANATVWDATHRFAARVFVAAGLLCAIAPWLGAPLAACFVVILVAALTPIPYSLWLYKRLECQGRV